MRKRYASTMQKIILTQAPMEADIEIAVEEKIQEFKSGTDFQDMIRAEVAKAFDRLHTIEEQISKQQEKAEEIGQGILNELYERELEK